MSQTDDELYFYVPAWDGRPQRWRLPRPGGISVEAAPPPPVYEPRPPLAVVAVDLGQAQDYSAVCVTEARRANPGSTGAAEYAHRVGHLGRWPLHTSYRKVAQDIAGICRLLPDPPILCIDFTGVGAAVAEQILEEQPRHSWWAPVSITGGDAPHLNERGIWCVPKKSLVSALSVASQNKHLAVPRSLPESVTLTKEMRNFRARIVPATGHVSYEPADWRSGSHDDLLLATALAVWAPTATPDFYVG